MKNKMTLSDEQNAFIKTALEGHNVLVDACIGSGKTTSIQELCNQFPKKKTILYMTYNRLLKLDAQDKIRNRNVTVTNYHGFVYPYLRKLKIRCGIGESIREFNRHAPKIKKYDVLIIDEYQDINKECAELLEIIKRQNPTIQIIAVGDMAQKIYDFTTHDVEPWIKEFLGNFKSINFTKCFRLNADLASKLSVSWNKPITGVNTTQKVRIMTPDEVTDYLATKEPEDILALSPKKGGGIEVLNNLQMINPDKFNKFTMYASIQQTDFNIDPDASVAIFTTYDSSKGMERPICVIFDYMPDYLSLRMNMPDVDPEIIRNIFLVAASRGKDEIIFVTKRRFHPYNRRNEFDKVGFIEIDEFLDLETNVPNYMPFNINTMFGFKYVEDIEDSYNMLKTTEIEPMSKRPLNIITNDGLLDLSPAIMTYAMGAFFKDYDVKEQLTYLLNNDEIDINKYKYFNHALNFQKVKERGGCYEKVQESPKGHGFPIKEGEIYETDFKHYADDLQWQLLVYLSASLGIMAYMKQVTKRYVTDSEKKILQERLSSEFNENDLHFIQTSLDGDNISFFGQADAIKDNIVYSVNYTNELRYSDYLQCAMYMILLGLEHGIVWNIRTNQKMMVEIPNRKEFLDQIVKTITKRNVYEFQGKLPAISQHINLT